MGVCWLNANLPLPDQGLPSACHFIQVNIIDRILSAINFKDEPYPV